MRLIDLPIISTINNHLVDYPCPVNLSYFWSFGSILGLCLAVQILSGTFLAMHYQPHIELAFDSVERIMRDVPHGWFIRYTHANGASMFFIAVYIHMARGIYYRSYMYPRISVWFSGLVIFILMMATAFLGYVLPWGQMSYWGATVITSLFSAIPVVGKPFVLWLWGGFSVDNPTLTRFCALHYTLPWLIAGMSGLHISLLHVHGSTNPLGIESKHDTIPFYPYYALKDLFAMLCFGWIWMFLVFFYPDLLGHPDNYIRANPLVTPAMICPEWYFLLFYAILRSIPDKLFGVLLMGLAIAILFILPFIDFSLVKGPDFRPHFKVFFWIFVANALLLGWVGTKPVEYPYISISQCCTVLYFSSFFVFIPLIGLIENQSAKNQMASSSTVFVNLLSRV